MDWLDEAVQEINGLKGHWVTKHGWDPRWVQETDAIVLYVDMTSKRLDGREFLLRLRYEPDWQEVGRREAFVDLSPPHDASAEFWPPKDKVRGVLPDHNRNGRVISCICLRGVWGYHSVLHPNEGMEGASLLGFLLELQKVMNE